MIRDAIGREIAETSSSHADLLAKIRERAHAWQQGAETGSTAALLRYELAVAELLQEAAERFARVGSAGMPRIEQWLNHGEWVFRLNYPDRLVLFRYWAGGPADGAVLPTPDESALLRVWDGVLAQHRASLPQKAAFDRDLPAHIVLLTACLSHFAITGFAGNPDALRLADDVLHHSRDRAVLLAAFTVAVCGEAAPGPEDGGGP